MRYQKVIALSVIIVFHIIVAWQSKNTGKDYLLLVVNSNKDEYAYKTTDGDTVIYPGKYSVCYTDTFRTYAIVLKSGSGFVGIDRNENFLYNVFSFDNAPDNVSNGFFRIIQNGKIGFADAVTGKVAIAPHFDGAYPFKNGIAKVGNGCTREADGEHYFWKGGEWFYIDTTGRKVTSPL